MSIAGINPFRAVSQSLASILDIGSKIYDSQSIDLLLNTVVLSVMGRLRISRACVLQHDQGTWATIYSRGVEPITISGVDVHSIVDLSIDDIQHECAEVLLASGIRYVVPVPSQTSSPLLLCLGEPIGGSSLQDDDLSYLGIIQLICSTALNNADVVSNMRSAQKELEAKNLLVSTLLQATKDYTGQQHPKDIVRLLSYRLMGQLMVSTITVVLNPAVIGSHIEHVGSHPTTVQLYEHKLVDIQRVTVVQPDVVDNELYNRLVTDRVAVVSPMYVRGQRHGTLLVNHKLSGKPFSTSELELIEALANITMNAIDAQRLARVEVEKLAMSKQIEVASEIQSMLLPSATEVVEGLDVSASMTPSAQVGGDYYDIIKLDDNRVLFAVADVAGKGIPAALLMSNVQAALNSLAPLNLPLPEMVQSINSLIYDNTRPETFITMFIAVVDTNTYDVQYVNAGHNPPLRVGKETSWLKLGGIILGVLRNEVEYSQGSTTLESGDVLVLYTDGVTEAHNHTREMYDVHRLESSIRTYQKQTAAEIRQKIESDLQAFTDAQELEDDTTLIVIKRP